ncbi:MAG: YncE family protein [Candidatus Acidiferrales bacterium]
MKFRYILGILGWFTLAALLIGAAAARLNSSLAATPDGSPGLGAKPLKQIDSIELPGPAGRRFDYLTIDPDDHLLFCAHMSAGNLYAIDLRTNKVVNTIPGVPGIEGVEYVPDQKKVYTSDSGDDQIAVIHIPTMKIVKRIPTESKPDGSTYAAPFQKLYVSDERAKAVAVVDVTTDEVVRMLRFQSETGMPQYDPVARLVYVNLQDQNLFAVIDPSTDTVLDRHPIGRCRGNHGMALDPEHHRAFLACEENNLLAVIDLNTNEPIAYVPVPEGADVVKFDPGLGRIYVACYSGAISVIEQKDPAYYAKLADVRVAHAVHSLAVDPATHRVYAPEQEESGVPVSRLIVFDAQ